MWALHEAHLSDLFPIALWLLSAVTGRLRALQRIPMPDTPEHPADAPIATAPADGPEAAANPSAVVNAVVQSVQAHPGVPAEHAASIITSILAGLYQATPAIFAVSRAGVKTQTEVGLGFGLAQIILGAFLHPNIPVGS